MNPNAPTGQKNRSGERADGPRPIYVVGNSPLLGIVDMRVPLGDGYRKAPRNIYPRASDSADLVMY
uniref:Uncharacterized protein n=1 Tax=Candidatus Kentrum sp. LFY TaxID=2126342 RepID=A0A450VBJ9_9GAMM|nr:MAG: hypothetical protein BECKLFY1418A_GA0070994_11791 [Candidatus Kentron sp. LFY]